jgi:DNA-binding CsgD family transcriptional regulator
LLATLGPSDLPMQTMGQRRIWLARAELALAQADARSALRIADQLLETAAHLAPGERPTIPHLALVRAQALAALGRWPEAEQALLAARTVAQTQQIPRQVWRLEAALGHVFEAQDRADDAARARAAARAVVETIAAGLPDPDLRAGFLRQSAAQFSLPGGLPAPAPPAAPRHYPAGLTAREVEVLGLVAQGATNRQIAAALHISARTVNTHLTNIFNKIGCENRTAATAFALQHGLA